MDLKQSIQFFKGVGPKRAKLLAHLGISTIEDLLHYYPRDWEDRKETSLPPPADGRLVLRGRVIESWNIHTRARLEIFKATLHIPAWKKTVDASWFKRMGRGFDVFKKLKADAKPGADIWIVAHCEPELLDAKEIRVDEYYSLNDPRT